MIDTKFLDQLRAFNLIIHKRVTSNYSGERRSIAQGRGIVFKDHRVYAPGDDFRAIDWKVYARTDDLFVKNYEEERNLVVHILLDASKSMDFGKKFDYASMFGIGFAYLALKENEKFQFSTFSDDINIFQPQKGMSKILSMVNYLNSLKLEGRSEIDKALIIYKKFLKTRGMVVLVSDFLIPLEKIKTAIYCLGRHEIKLIQILDPLEINFELGNFHLIDSETNESMKTNISLKLREEYKNLLEEHSSKIKEICSTLGIDFYTITTDMDIFDAFYKILD